MEGMKNIPMCDLFYWMVLDIARPLTQTFSGKKYLLFAIGHYLKCCEARLLKEHDVVIVAKFLEDEIICRFEVPKYILIDNGNEWMKKFDVLC